MGGKSATLAYLGKAGIRVPQGFCLDADHFQEAIRALRDGDRCPPGRGFAKDFASDVHVPSRTSEAIQKGLLALNPTALFAVRSSAKAFTRGQEASEDGTHISMAGLFDSFLAVPRSKVEEAVKLCWASLFGERAMAALGADETYLLHSEMSVVVQEFIPAKSSAVVMTVDPQGDGSYGALECSWGPCEAIVCGAVSPDEHLFCRDCGELLSSAISDKNIVVAYEPGRSVTNNAIKSLVSEVDRSRSCMSPVNLADIIKTARKIETLMGCPQDIELVVDSSDNIVITQSRPITTLPRLSSNCLSLGKRCNHGTIH